MKFEIGTPLYLYTARNGKFNIYEGEVVESKYRYRYGRNISVKFKTAHQRELCPKESEIGHVQSGGPRLWLIERDDNLARKLLLEYEEGKLAELEKALVKKQELIKVLREGVADA